MQALVRIFILLTLFNLTSCRAKNEYRQSMYSSENEGEHSDEKYSDDTYCATIEYFNPNTGTQSSYTLTVIVESNEVVQINFPNGGRLDNSHFSGAKLEEDGTTSFESDKGYEYNIEIIGRGSDCLEDVPKAVRCMGKTKKGLQCKNMTDNETGLCWRHQDQK